MVKAAYLHGGALRAALATPLQGRPDLTATQLARCRGGNHSLFFCVHTISYSEVLHLITRITRYYIKYKTLQFLTRNYTIYIYIAIHYHGFHGITQHYMTLHGIT